MNLQRLLRHAVFRLWAGGAGCRASCHTSPRNLFLVNNAQVLNENMTPSPHVGEAVEDIKNDPGHGNHLRPKPTSYALLLLRRAPDHSPLLYFMPQDNIEIHRKLFVPYLMHRS